METGPSGAFTQTLDGNSERRAQSPAAVAGARLPRAFCCLEKPLAGPKHSKENPEGSACARLKRTQQSPGLHVRTGGGLAAISSAAFCPRVQIPRWPSSSRPEVIHNWGPLVKNPAASPSLKKYSKFKNVKKLLKSHHHQQAMFPLPETTATPTGKSKTTMRAAAFSSAKLLRTLITE